MTGTFKGSYRFKPEGRQWEVMSESGNSYTVTIWVDPQFGRLALCSCRASEFDRPCRHLQFIGCADAVLFDAPVREIQPIAA
jgi:hypothetical protein